MKKKGLVYPMFVVSVRSSRFKRTAAVALALVLLTIGGLYLVSKRPSQQVVNQSPIVFDAKTKAQRLSFFSQFGWQVDPDSQEVKEVLIPDPLDDVYETYNDLQKQQGFDLSAFQGKRVKCYSFDVLNYPNFETQSGVIRGTILVHKDKVIAGDIASTALGGFMHTLDMPDVTPRE